MRPALTLLALPMVICTLNAAPAQRSNPFFTEWKTPFGVPPFAEIKPEHFLPAYQEGMARQKAEIAKITQNAAAPTFQNTVEALDDSGTFLARVEEVFSNLLGSDTSDTLQALAKQLSPLTSAHQDDIALNEALFQRVKAVHAKRGALKLNRAQDRLLELTYKGFVRGGADLKPEQKNRLRAINAELSMQALRFNENLLKETNAFRLVINKPEDLDGLPEGVRASGAEDAKAAGLPGKWVYTLHYPSIWPFMTYAKNRELRRQLFTAYTTRCDHGDAFDNKAILAKIAALRVEKAQLLGYPTWAHFSLDDAMAKTPDRVQKLLDQLWQPALKRAGSEIAEMQALINAEKGGFQLASWDWWYYADKVKKAKYDLDDEALKPYFALDKVRQGAFDVASKLYGITFKELKNMPLYHPEARAFEVQEKDGRHVGVFYVDYHPRSSKRGGAWMSNFRSQWRQGGKDIRPVIVNVCNFSRPSAEAPALLSADEVTTLFHEFGHALHGLLTQCRYRSQSGTSVSRDFVELPSQVMENWAMEPQVLRSYAKHYKTGEVLPDTLIAKMEKARHFNQGFATVEYLAASKLDMDWHTLTDPKPVDAARFEKASLEKMGMPAEIVSRYRSTYFGHIVGGYAAGYYSYIWAAVLDADAFQAFKDKGDLFHPATAKAFRENVLDKGGSEDPMSLYTRFRGAEPSVEPLLQRRGLK